MWEDVYFVLVNIDVRMLDALNETNLLLMHI